MKHNGGPEELLSLLIDILKHSRFLLLIFEILARSQSIHFFFNIGVKLRGKCHANRGGGQKTNLCIETVERLFAKTYFCVRIYVLGGGYQIFKKGR